MNSLSVLVRMQLKEKLDLSFLKSRKQTVFKITYFVLGFAFITAIVYILMHFAVMLKLLTLTTRLPLSLLVFVFTVMQLLSLITSTFSIMNALYFSGDNQILLTLPVNANTVFFSKIIVHYVYELKKSFIYIMPIFIAFGLKNSYSLGFYPVLIVAFLLITLIMVSLSALLSIPSSYIAGFLREHRILQMALAAGFCVFAIYAFLVSVSLIPTNIDLVGVFGKYYWEIQAFLNKFSQRAFLFAYLVQMATGRVDFYSHRAITGETLLIFLCVIAICAALFALAFALTRPLYFKMVSKPYEYKTIRTRAHKNRKLSRYFTSLKKEMLLKVRTPVLLVQSVVSIALLPFAIYLLNKCFAAMNTRLLGDLAAMTFNYFLALLIILNGNAQCAAIFSSEGNAVYVLKTTPESVRSNIAAKLTVIVLLSTISIVVTGYISMVMNNLTLEFGILNMLTILFLNIGHIFWSVEMDIVNPQYIHFINGIHVTGNPNETKSTIAAFALCFITTVIFAFLIFENHLIVWYKIFAIALCFLAARIYLLVCNAKVYFRDI